MFSEAVFTHPQNRAQPLDRLPLALGRACLKGRRLFMFHHAHTKAFFYIQLLVTELVSHMASTQRVEAKLVLDSVTACTPNLTIDNQIASVSDTPQK